MRFLSLSLAAGALAVSPATALAQTPESTCAAKAKTKTVERAGNGEIDYGRCVIRVFGNGARLVRWAKVPAPSLGRGDGRAQRRWTCPNILEVAKGCAPRVRAPPTARLSEPNGAHQGAGRHP